MNITYENVKLSDLKIEKFNRKINLGHAKKIAAFWDDKLAGVVIASEKNGYYDIIDGQHRVYAANLINKDSIMCLVYHDLKTEEDAEIFIKLDKNRKALNTYDYIRAAHVANDDVVTSMYAIAKMAGFEISNQSGDNKIAAVRSMLNVISKSGRDSTATVLLTIKEAWDGDRDSLRGEMLEGMNHLLSTYGRQIDRARLIKKIKTVMPYKILAEANVDQSRTMKRTKVARALLNHYNSSLRNGRLQDIL